MRARLEVINNHRDCTKFLSRDYGIGTLLSHCNILLGLLLFVLIVKRFGSLRERRYISVYQTFSGPYSNKKTTKTNCDSCILEFYNLAFGHFNEVIVYTAFYHRKCIYISQEQIQGVIIV